jgi:hypothetical protein
VPLSVKLIAGAYHQVVLVWVRLVDIVAISARHTYIVHIYAPVFDAAIEHARNSTIEQAAERQAGSWPRLMPYSSAHRSARVRAACRTKHKNERETSPSTTCTYMMLFRACMQQA